jgi:ABC-type transport system substrate-binding protein
MNREANGGRRPFGRVWALLIAASLAGGGWLAAQPPKKPAEEEPAAPKGKKPVADDEEPGKPAKKPAAADDEDVPGGAKAKEAALAPELDLAAEVKSNKNDDLRELFTRIEKPFDLVRMPGEEVKAEPLGEYIGDQPNKKRLEFRPLDARGKQRVIASVGEIKWVRPYELVIAEEVNNLFKAGLDKVPPTSNRYLTKLDQLAVAERLLSNAVRFHDKTRSGDEGKKAPGWEAVGKQVRGELRSVQMARLNGLADAGQWDEVAQELNRFNQAYPSDARAQAEMVRVRLKRIDAKVPGVREDDHQKVRDAMAALESRLPRATDTTLAEFRKDMYSKGAAYLTEARALQAANKLDEARKLVGLAAVLGPDLPGVRDVQRVVINAFPVLYVGVPKLPELMSPAAARTDTERQACELIFESLVCEAPDLRTGTAYRAALADGPPHTSTLGREFRLVGDARWVAAGPPGAPPQALGPVTALDVAGTLELLKQPPPAGSAGDQLPVYKRARYPGPEDIDLLTSQVSANQLGLSLTLSRGFIDPLELMSFKVLPAEKVLAGQRADDDAFAKKPIGSGPFYFAGFEEGAKRQAVFKANPYYGERASRVGRPMLREVRFVEPSGNLVTDFVNHQLHVVLGLSTEELFALKEEAQQQAGSVRLKDYAPPHRRMHLLAVNHRRPAMESQELRREIAHAINRKEILDKIYRAQGKGEAYHRALTGPFPPDCWASPDRSEQKDLYQESLAKQLEGKRGGGKVTLTLAAPDDAKSKRVVAMIQEQLGKVTPDVTIAPRFLDPEKLRVTVEQTNDFDLAYVTFDYDSDLYWLGGLFDPAATGFGGRNYMGYKPDADFAELLRVIRTHRDFSKLREKMHRLNNEFVGPNGRMPFIPLWQLDQHIVIRDDVQTSPPPDQLDPLTVFGQAEGWRIGSRAASR